ncbi:MAG: DUF924 family protein [Deltaproteobacteria bacterium]
MSKTTTADEVLNFWFNECTPEQWYKKDADFDALIFRRFETAVSAALKGEMEAWQTDLKGCLAIILMLDQFTRNIFRNTPKAFLGDKKALELSLICHDKGYLQHDNPAYRQFMLMPMMHSEDIAIQDQSLSLFKEFTSERIYEYAIRHREIIQRFGRFPHRNQILGRISTEEEIEFLKQPGSSF